MFLLVPPVSVLTVVVLGVCMMKVLVVRFGTKKLVIFYFAGGVVLVFPENFLVLVF